MALKKGTTIRVLAVCGAGMGTCAFIKSNVESVLRNHGVQAIVNVESAANVNTNSIRNCDVIFTSKNIAESKLAPIVKSGTIPVIVLLNIMSKQEYNDRIEKELLPLFTE